MIGVFFLFALSIFCSQIALSDQLTDMSDCAVNGDGTANCTAVNPTLPPLILIHGISGSKMYVDGKNTAFPSNLPLACSVTYSGTYSLKAWISYSLGVSDPLNIQKCILYMMSLTYDSSTGTYHNQTGLNVTFLGRHPFGLTCPLTCLLTDSLQSCNPTANSTSTEVYFGALISYLAQFGYVKGCNLFAAPYDWRLVPQLDAMDAYFTNLTKLIETSVNQTGKKAFLLSHSMGNLMVNNFLNQRKSNADRFFGGASYIISNTAVRDLIRTFASPAILLPNLLAFQSGTPVVTVQGTTYTVGNMANLLALANVANMATLYQNSASQIGAQQYTPMYCVHGNSDNSTALQYTYPNGINSAGTATLGAGDGTVNIDSLRVCQVWKNQGKLVNQVTEIPNVSHTGILLAQPFYTVVKTILIG
uniref:Lipase n=1 Tax=Globodera pallida TaxID=36090 RepID=A0A183CG34_GLOPA